MVDGYGLLGALVVLIFMAFLIALVVWIIVAIALWGVFKKAGKPGWGGFVPFYNLYLMLEIAELPMWTYLFFFVPMANAVFCYIVLWNIGRAFGKSTAFGIGLLLMCPIFLMILAFDDSTYIGINNQMN